MFGKNKTNRSEGKGTEKTVSFSKTIEVLNYTPIEYRLTKRWAEFSDIDKFEDRYTKKIKGLDVDEMCGELYDSEILMEAALMKASAAEQQIHHKSLIQHNKGVFKEDLEKLNRLLADLENDLTNLDREIERLKSLQKKETEQYA